jgi:hypothetical protein
MQVAAISTPHQTSTRLNAAKNIGNQAEIWRKLDISLLQQIRGFSRPANAERPPSEFACLVQDSTLINLKNRGRKSTDGS